MNHNFPIDPRLDNHPSKAMAPNCQFCHQAPKALNCRWSCLDCEKWLQSLNYNYATSNGQLTHVWFKLFVDKDKHYHLYFYLGDDFDEPKTVIEEYSSGFWQRTALRINYLLPINKKTIEDLPKKLKLWQTFS